MNDRKHFPEFNLRNSNMHAVLSCYCHSQKCELLTYFDRIYYLFSVFCFLLHVVDFIIGRIILKCTIWK